MKRFLLLLFWSGLIAVGGQAADTAALPTTSVMVQDFEKATALPKVWVVGIPDGNAAAKFVTEHPFQGQQCLALHYHFTDAGQYLGLPLPVTIQVPVHKLHWMLYGDGSDCGYGLYVTDSNNETHKYRDPATMKVNFKGWKAIDIDLDAPHEAWGGDKNGKLDYPLTGITLEISHDSKTPIESDLYFDAFRVDSEKSVVETVGGHVAVTAPAYGADIKGDTRIAFNALGFTRVVATVWQIGGTSGSRATVATEYLNTDGTGSINLPANAYPHGPITVMLTGEKALIGITAIFSFITRVVFLGKKECPRHHPPQRKA